MKNMNSSGNCLRALALLAASVLGAGAAGASAPTIEVLSNRADLISGGDALVELHLPPGTALGDVSVDVDGRDVRAAFALRPNGRVMGLVDGLPLGESRLTLRLPDGSGAVLPLTNHPRGGPVLAGPQVEPWICSTETNGLGPAQDEDCNAPPQFRFQYKNVATQIFQNYDPTSPPPDSWIARTTTDEGKTVPFIVRIETGAQNRGVYKITVLFDPAESPTPWSPPTPWNGKVYWFFGGGCNTNHQQGEPGGGNLNLLAEIGRGFMQATSSNNKTGEKCNLHTSAESVVMLKEHIIESYGEIRYTLAEGCSGGSVGQQLISNAYPGLFQGIQPNCSFPDLGTPGYEVYDCHVLENYYRNISPGLWGVAEQRAAVNGHASAATCTSWEELFSKVLDPTTNENGNPACGLPEGQGYDPVTNPTGCRATVQDLGVSLIGRRPPELWSESDPVVAAAEAAAGGFARIYYGNVGVQYGLDALFDGLITAEQFVDLNEKIGSVDVDFNIVPYRRYADPGAVEIFHRISHVNDGRELDAIPIIDLRGTSNFEFHTDFHSYAMRERLRASNGHSDNQIIWTFHSAPVTPIPPPAIEELSFDLLDRWVAAVEADARDVPREQKVLDHKPSEASDACFDPNGIRIDDPTACAAAFPFFGNPRIAAGGPLSNDVLECALKPLARSDYASLVVPFSDAQWARLEAAFPDGVCDWDAPAPGAAPTLPWLSFQGGPGGEPLGPVPVSLPEPEPWLGFGAALAMLGRISRRRGRGI